MGKSKLKYFILSKWKESCIVTIQITVQILICTSTDHCTSVAWNNFVIFHSCAARISLVLHSRTVNTNHVLMPCVNRQNDSSCGLVCRATSIVGQYNVFPCIFRGQCVYFSRSILGCNIIRKGFDRERRARNGVQIRWAVNVAMIGLSVVVMKLMM